jgi:hypothetical protein
MVQCGTIQYFCIYVCILSSTNILFHPDLFSIVEIRDRQAVTYFPFFVNRHFTSGVQRSQKHLSVYQARLSLSNLKIRGHVLKTREVFGDKSSKFGELSGEKQNGISLQKFEAKIGFSFVFRLK